MSDTPELHDIKWSYIVLGAEHNDSALVIKQRYRALCKQWHPDKWISDEAHHEKATRKMQDINNAYAMIRDAPMRYHISTHPRVQDRWDKRAQRTGQAHRAHARAYDPEAREKARQDALAMARRRRRAEYWFRFFFGMFASGPLLILIHMEQWANRDFFMILCVVLPLLFGWLAARHKDDFWSGAGEMFYWWWWFR